MSVPTTRDLNISGWPGTLWRTTNDYLRIARLPVSQRRLDAEEALEAVLRCADDHASAMTAIYAAADPEFLLIFAIETFLNSVPDTVHRPVLDNALRWARSNHERNRQMRGQRA